MKKIIRTKVYSANYSNTRKSLSNFSIPNSISIINQPNHESVQTNPIPTLDQFRENTPSISNQNESLLHEQSCIDHNHFNINENCVAFQRENFGQNIQVKDTNVNDMNHKIHQKRKKKNSKCERRWIALSLLAASVIIGLVVIIPTILLIYKKQTVKSTVTTTTTTAVTLYIPGNYYTSCANSCTNVTTSTASTLMASWNFENNLDEDTNTYNGYMAGNGSARYISGYINQALSLNSNGYVISNSSLNFANRSFTIEVWLIVTQTIVSSSDYGIFCQCQAAVIETCLHLIIRTNVFYFGFYIDDLTGITPVPTNIWTHVAFVYDYSLNKQSIYINGILDSTRSATGPYQGQSGAIYIGYADPTAIFGAFKFPGSIDKITISNRVKSACEILNDATLVSYYSFDGTYADNGPNDLPSYITQNNNPGVSYVSGRINQALSFSQSNSYFQSCSYQSLSISNQPYSFALWIYPDVSTGTILHLTSDRLGAGSWCLPMIGFSLNGSIIVQSWTGSIVSVWGPQIPQFNWTHLAVTWSSSNGLRLYVNGALFNSATMSTFATNSASNMCIFLATSGLGTGCATADIRMGSYMGIIDEFYVYSRELTINDICPLAHR